MRAISILLLLLAGACAPPTLRFRTEVKGEATIPGSPFGALLGVLPPVSGLSDIDFDQNQDFRNQGVTKDDVRSVRVERVVFTVLSPSGQTFSFLDTIEVVARIPQKEQRVASKRGPFGASSLSLDLENPDVTDFVTAPKTTLTVSGSGRQPDRDTQVEAVVGLEVEALIL